jgi:hypothetical protein
LYRWIRQRLLHGFLLVGHLRQYFYFLLLDD